MVGLYGLRWTRRALPLSKHHSLALYIVLGDGMWQYDRAVKDLDVELPLIMAERHRVASMFINRRRSTNNPLLEPQVLLALPMPRLRVLAVSSTSLNMQPLDATTFSGEIPLSLEDLQLYNCPVRPTCTLLQAPLTHLQISGCLIWEFLSELLGALSGLPQLETLDWEDLSSEVTLNTGPLAFSTKSSYNAVHLPHLRNVTLDTSIEVIAQFFVHVKFPISCSIEANADLTNIPREDLVHVCPALDVAFGERLRAIFGDGKEHSGFKVLEISPFEDDVSNGAVLAWRDPTSPQAPASYHLGFRPSTEDEGHLHSDVLLIINHILDNWPAAHDVVSEVHVRHPAFMIYVASIQSTGV
ncbi:hypothetical protein PENSPDRAFT_754923 [Peniophora sp. CONT]|nr:hypothetical protein PENSPDRAFT_754923 [Peniophora sp. CONT]